MREMTRFDEWCLQSFTRVAGALMSLAPAAAHPDDSETIDDQRTTLVEVLRGAYARRGRVGLMREGVFECGNLLLIALRIAPSRRESASAHGATAERERPSTVRRLSNDARLAFRSLVTGAGPAWLAVLMLALGIGLGTATFSVLDAILWRPVPYPQADRLVTLAAFDTARKFSFMGFYSPSLMRTWRDQTDIFDRVEGYDTPSFIYTTPQGSDMVPGAIVTPGLFSLLGATPQVGRLLGPGDGKPGTSDVIVVSDAFWRERLQRDPNVVDRDITLDGQHCRIAGVLPATFRFPNGDIQVWRPFDIDAASGAKARTMTVLARIAPGVTDKAAATQARDRGARLSASVGESATLTSITYSLGNSTDEKTRRSLGILAGAVGFLFLVVCANVGNLTLSRSAARARDLAVRAALGASRGDLVRETLVESAVVAGIGCAAGVGLAALLVKVALALLPDTMTRSAMNLLAIDNRALVVAIALGVLSSLLFGIPAAIAASGASVNTLLASRSRGSSGTSASRRFRSVLVVVEVAVSIVLLIGAALMARSFVQLQSVGKGFDASNLITVRLGLPSPDYADAATRDQFVQSIVDRIRQTPGFLGAIGTGLPTELRPIMLGPVEFAHVPGQKSAPMIVPMESVTTDYFSVLGLPLISGRTFRADDEPGRVMVSQEFAKKYWPDGQAIGGRFRTERLDWQTVIGIVGDVRPMDPDDKQRSRSQLYFQAGKAPKPMVPTMPVSAIAEYRNIVVRASRPADAVAVLPQLVHGLDPHVVIWRIAAVDHLYADAIARPRVVLALLAIFAGAGLILALAGIYGVLAYLVKQRVREIGIRLALGARPADVGRLVMTGGLSLTAIGLVIGLGLALALAQAMRTALYEVGPADPVAIAGVSVLLIAAASLASWRPARQAMRVDPISLLRED